MKGTSFLLRCRQRRAFASFLPSLTEKKGLKVSSLSLFSPPTKTRLAEGKRGWKEGRETEGGKVFTASPFFHCKISLRDSPFPSPPPPYQEATTPEKKTSLHPLSFSPSLCTPLEAFLKSRKKQKKCALLCFFGSTMFSLIALLNTKAELCLVWWGLPRLSRSY